jgi:hypothetical protein
MRISETPRMRRLSIKISEAKQWRMENRLALDPVEANLCQAARRRELFLGPFGSF